MVRDVKKQFFFRLFFLPSFFFCFLYVFVSSLYNFLVLNVNQCRHGVEAVRLKMQFCALKVHEILL